MEQPFPAGRWPGSVGEQPSTDGSVGLPGWGMLTHRGGGRTTRPGCARVLPVPFSCHGGACRCKSLNSKQSPCSAATLSLLSLCSGRIGPERGRGGDGFGARAPPAIHPVQPAQP